jgi:hypothetical protein
MLVSLHLHMLSRAQKVLPDRLIEESTVIQPLLEIRGGNCAIKSNVKVRWLTFVDHL